MKKLIFVVLIILMNLNIAGQTLTETQLRNARATGYAIVASKNPGIDFSILMIPWDGSNTLEYNANNQINSGWHAQAAVKGNYFDQNFNGNDFSFYSSVVLSQSQFDVYKSTGTQWWIVCSTLPPFSQTNNKFTTLEVTGNSTLTGNVGIGTSTPGNYKLNVSGKIRANEVVVNTTGADFVFDRDYKLPGLSDVDSFIKKNKHLPGIASAAEMKENGMNVSEAQTRLLQKVEELTLYIIQQDKKLSEVDKSNARLEKEIQALNELIAKSK
jgi:hypothetical protein